LPRYDYICENCEGGYTFELKQAFDSKPIAECPVCGTLSKRQFSSVPIVFKGSGWYVNDYGKKSTAAPGAKPSDSTGDASKNDASTSEGSKTTESSSQKKPDSKTSKSGTKPSGK